ncbi:MAG: DUF5060 domain-containing protein [Lentisphaeria bacterium]|nr:DUF5060 domain-containing protein [Lentisphaeria bacterium]
MIHRLPRSAILGVIMIAGFASAAALVPVGDVPHRVWAMSEFAVKDGPESENPYDPDLLALDAVFRSPSGREIRLPAFWYTAYARELKEDKEEVLTPSGDAGWRVRFTPVEAGEHRYWLEATSGGQTTRLGEGAFDVGEAALGARGFARIEPQAKRYFATDDGQPLPLLGECCCWHGKRGTYDFDDWFAVYRPSGMNYTRLWMCPWAFGLETVAEERTRYNQSMAWQLDHTLDLAAREGIFVMLCLDYHGIFNVDPDMWGGNNWWPKHAYNQANGGPCANQNEFFTQPEAERLYRKRLRYLVGRYSAYPSLMSWQFFNEINNVFRFLKPADVVAWHDRQSRWLDGNDPYRHPVTTSFGSRGEHPPMWKLESMAFANWHLYLNWAGNYRHPAAMCEDVASRFRRDYGKPVVISEYGTSGLAWKPEIDPHLRGLQQAVWGGIMAGTAGTSMPWWWQDMHRDKVHGRIWGPLARFIEGTGFGGPAWQPILLPKPSGNLQLGKSVAGGQPFTARLACVGNWGQKEGGVVVLANAAASTGSLHVFLHGNDKPELRLPCRIQVELGPDAALTVQVNSVSNGAELEVLANGQRRFHRPFPDQDGKTLVNGEYNESVRVELPPGRQTIELRNPGQDWLALDWVEIAGALPCEALRPANEPTVLAYAMGDGEQALLWIIDPAFNYPDGALETEPKPIRARVELPGLPDGGYAVEFWNTWTGQATGTAKAHSANGRLAIEFPEFQVDAAARIRPER